MGKKKICWHIKNELVPATFVNLIFRNFAWNDDVKSFFVLWGRVEWDWHMEMSYLTSLNPQLFKNIAKVGSFKHFSVQLFFYMYFTTRPRPALTAVVYMCTIFDFWSTNIACGQISGMTLTRYDLTHMWCWSGLGIFHRKPISFFSVCFPITWRNLFLHLPPRKQWWAPGRLLIAVHTPLHLLHLINCV